VVLGITQHAAASGADVDVKLIASGGSFKITAKAAVTMTTGGTLLYLYGTAAEGKFGSSDQGSGVLWFRALQGASGDGSIIEATPKIL
jgi:hypothetical protein